MSHSAFQKTRLLHSMHGRRHDQGYALVTGVIFLVVLTIVAVFALKGTGLEMKMGANNAFSTQAFEAAEAPRTLMTQLIDIHIYNRGWPAAKGGNIPDDQFNYTIPNEFILRSDSSSVPYNWYTGSFMTTTTFSPLDWSTIDASYSRNVATAGTNNFLLQASMTIKKLRVGQSPGAGAAMNAGYEGLGKGAAAGGGDLYFYVLASGLDPKTQATALTATAYRYVIRN